MCPLNFKPVMLIAMDSTAMTSVARCFVPERCDRVTGQCEGECQIELKGPTSDAGTTLV